MRPLLISDATSVWGLQQEMQRSEESRYDHRLHGVLVVAQGMTCPEVARLLGDAPRAVEYWFHRFDPQGLAGLTEGERSGRPRRRNQKQVKEIHRVLRQRPSDAGMRVHLWDGKTLSAWIEILPPCVCGMARFCFAARPEDATERPSGNSLK